MKPGDLVRVREGCGDEGKVGIIILCHAVKKTIAFYDVLLPGVGSVKLNGYWLEVISECR